MKTVFITGADRGIGLALCKCFLDGGYQVFAGQYMSRWKELEQLQENFPDRLVLVSLDVSSDESVKNAAKQVAEQTRSLDMLINCAGVAIGDEPEQIRTMFNINSLGPMRMVEAFLPLMKEGDKRLCFVSSEAGSISVAHRKGVYGYGMSKSALNMAVRLMFNRLRKEGYIFRLYHPGWVKSYMAGDVKSTIGTYEPEETARVAYETFTEDRDWEDVLVMTDICREMWPF